MDFFELRRRELVRLALVNFYGVGGGLRAFFEEPDDALGAGLLEPERDSQYFMSSDSDSIDAKD